MQDPSLFIASHNRLRILSRIHSVRFVSGSPVPGWLTLEAEAKQILKEAGISTVSGAQFEEGQGDGMLLIKWGLPGDAQGIAQLVLYAEMQAPGTDDLHYCIVWTSQTLVMCDLTKGDEMRELLLNEIREFAAACLTARSLPSSK